MNPLVVVDMQAAFEAATVGRTIRACKKLISHALQNKDPVILVEFEQFGETIWDIKNVVPDAIIVKKYRMGGGDVVASKLKEINCNASKINICGVNSEMCLRETALELAHLLPQVTVNIVKSACNTETPNFRWSELNDCLQVYQNLRLVSQIEVS